VIDEREHEPVTVAFDSHSCPVAFRVDDWTDPAAIVAFITQAIRDGLRVETMATADARRLRFGCTERPRQLGLLTVAAQLPLGSEVA
jgi:hypothetical protein